MSRLFCILALSMLASVLVLAQHPTLRVVSYNVENLFDTQHDSLKNDSSYLPDGLHHWTYYRYSTKLQRIAQVIVNIGGWQSIPLVGLCEVENAHCLKDLCYKLRCYHYRYVHYESPDERGVDVALLYDSTLISILHSQPIRFNLPDDFTRDILYVKALYQGRDTIHTMVCHLPSQLGGATATQSKRDYAKRLIRKQINAILHNQPQAHIILMGDMNTPPEDDMHGMSNLMLDLQRAGQGTHKYQGQWTCLDQFYVSASLQAHSTVSIYSPAWLLEQDSKYLDHQPSRTYVGYRYHGGYSDHLPIVLNIAVE